MWKWKPRLKYRIARKVHLVLPEVALTAIFDECDRFDEDETGGRIIGSYVSDFGGKLTIHVTGIITSGPRAQRSPVSLFQDGEYQEGVFRKIEELHPETEHLGSWHTHHVNGLRVLSAGDVSTYQRTVNHARHNTPFFYALLVTSKRRSSNSRHRYNVKHYLFRRGDKRVYRIPKSQVQVVDAPLVWPASVEGAEGRGYAAGPKLSAQPIRVYDREFIHECYPGFRPLVSPKWGFYWRGCLGLFDGSMVEVVVLEDSTARPPGYSVALLHPPEPLKEIAEALATHEFPSARAAIIATEGRCNHALW